MSFMRPAPRLDATPGARVQRRWREELSRLRWPVARLLAGLWGLALAVAVLPVGATSHRFFVSGFLVAAGAAGMAVLILLRTYRDTVGALAEDLSAEFLRKPGHRWLVLDNVLLNSVDVDHILVTADAVLAVETKFFGVGRSSTAWRAPAVRQAVAGADKVRRLLRFQSLGIQSDVPVIPVLMLWGPGVDEDHAWSIEDGVDVVAGPDEQWARARGGAATVGPEGHELLHHLQEFRRRQVTGR